MTAALAGRPAGRDHSGQSRYLSCRQASSQLCSFCQLAIIHELYGRVGRGLPCICIAPSYYVVLPYMHGLIGRTATLMICKGRTVLSLIRDPSSYLATSYLLHGVYNNYQFCATTKSKFVVPHHVCSHSFFSSGSHFDSFPPGCHARMKRFVKSHSGRKFSLGILFPHSLSHSFGRRHASISLPPNLMNRCLIAPIKLCGCGGEGKKSSPLGCMVDTRVRIFRPMQCHTPARHGRAHVMSEKCRFYSYKIDRL